MRRILFHVEQELLGGTGDGAPLRAERIIGAARLALLACAVVAVWLEPSTPPRFAHATSVALISYVVYSALLAALLVRTRAIRRRDTLIVHGVDLTLTSVLLYLTTGPGSPFFLFFTFALVAATIRWSWRGVAWTALIALVANTAIAFWDWRIAADPLFEVNRFVIRSFYVVVIGALLAYLGLHEERLRRELARRTREAAGADERVRVARDLHDGVLQSLTGAALQVQTAARLTERDPAEAGRMLEGIRRLIADEQRDLRFFIDELKPEPPGGPHGEGLEPALVALAHRLERVWGLAVELAPLPAVDAPDGLEAELYRIVQEAGVNAARHGRASRFEVRIARDDGTLTLVLTDNGQGFPYQGRFDHATLVASRRGPRSLRERVVALGGTVALETGGTGTRLEVRIPLPPAPAARTG